MSSLYELTEDVKALDQLLTEQGGDVSEGSDGQVLVKWAEEFQWKIANKIDAYGALHRNLEATADAIDAEIKRLRERKAAVEHRADRLLALAKFSMERMGVRKLEGNLFTIAVQKAGGVAPLEVLVDASKLPEAFRKSTVVYDADKDAIRAALEKKDPSLEGIAKLGERGEYVRIR